MIYVCNFKCSTCGYVFTTRTALGHDDYQTTTLSCPGCGVEIQYGMELPLRKRLQRIHKTAKSPEDLQKQMMALRLKDQIKYVNFKNCKKAKPGEVSQTVITTDGNLLVPVSPNEFSPFIAMFGKIDIQEFRSHQSMRRTCVDIHWPKIQRLYLHLDRGQTDLFDKQLKDLQLEPAPINDAERQQAAFIATELYGRIFSSSTHNLRRRINQRIALAESISSSLTKQLSEYFHNQGKDESLIRELNLVRENWVKNYETLAPVFVCLYLDENKASLDSFSVPNKRFDELKHLYADCFETFCRISVIAAGLEGIIDKNVVGVPIPTRVMTIHEFDVEKNGLKAGYLKPLPIGDLFEPFIDHNLRNGVGHNSAHYEPMTDVIEYITENRKKRKVHLISYTRFCEKLVRLYGQLEIVSTYAHWLRLKGLGII